MEYDVKFGVLRVGNAHMEVVALDNLRGRPAWHTALALGHASLGQFADAKVVFDRLGADGFASLPRDSTWLGAMANLAEVAGMLADSLTELFAARALVYETARGIDRGADVKVSHAQCSMAKLYSSEMAGRVADRAVQVFGGRGYMRENVAERFFRELRVERIWEGTSEIQRMIIARQMTKRTPAALA